jgi:hypothetical protein
METALLTAALFEVGEVDELPHPKTARRLDATTSRYIVLFIYAPSGVCNRMKRKSSEKVPAPSGAFSPVVPRPL